MPKNIEPSKGFPMSEIIEKLHQDPEKAFTSRLNWLNKKDIKLNDTDNAFFSDLFCGLLPLINPETCATEDQIFQLENLMSPDTPGPENAFVKSMELGSPEFFSFANLINGFRHECISCLNDHCKQRDPAHPVAEVLKRVPEKK